MSTKWIFDWWALCHHLLFMLYIGSLGAIIDLRTTQIITIAAATGIIGDIVRPVIVERRWQ